MAVDAYVVNCGPAGGVVNIDSTTLAAQLAAFDAANLDTVTTALQAYVEANDPSIPVGDISPGDLAQDVNGGVGD